VSFRHGWPRATSQQDRARGRLKSAEYVISRARAGIFRRSTAKAPSAWTPGGALWLTSF